MLEDENWGTCWRGCPGPDGLHHDPRTRPEPSDPAFQITGRVLEVGLEGPGEIRVGTGQGTGIGN